MATQPAIDQHACEYHRCTAADVFTVKGDSDEAAVLIADSDKYLSQFVAPVKDDDGNPMCFHCGARLSGMLHAFGAGASYVWGLVHGEATCSGCDWPARGMHYPKGDDGKDLWSARNLFLAYHPDVVEQSK